jgi:hypothetical protein
LIYVTDIEKPPAGAHLAKIQEIDEIMDKLNLSYSNLRDMCEKGLPGPEIFTIGFAAAGALGFGDAFEGGLAFDFRKGFKIGIYRNLQIEWGFDYSVGGVWSYHQPKLGHQLEIRDLSEYGESRGAGIFFFDFGPGGNTNNKILNPSNLSSNHKSYETVSFGFSRGSPIGVTFKKGYTWIPYILKN